MRWKSTLPAALFTFAIAAVTASAAEPLTLENVPSPGANSADEPLAEQYSLERAERFMDTAALDWTKNRKCFTCHTNYAYLISRGAGAQQTTAHRQVRQALEQLVSQRWEEHGPRWDAEVVMSAAALALNDQATTGRLHAVTRAALDRMWSLQRDDGGFDWLKCKWPPMESDDHYGATMALVGVGAAPENYADTPAAQKGLQKLRTYLQENPPPTLHHRAMVLWASTYIEGVTTATQRKQTVKALLSKQNRDGGWTLAALGDWQRSDDKQQDTKTSDGYGTGFVVYVLHRAGVPADDPQIKKGIAWLKSHQRASGRWFTRSLNKDNKHYITHAGTAFALLALRECQTAN